MRGKVLAVGACDTLDGSSASKSSEGDKSNRNLEDHYANGVSLRKLRDACNSTRRVKR